MTDLPRPPFDPELEAFLTVIGQSMPPTITPELIAPMRAGMKSMLPSVDTLLAGRAIDHREQVIDGPVGPITLSIFSPRGLTHPAPCVYHTHGGGMIIGDRFTGADLYLDWVDKLGCVVVSVEYRLAPEHPHPVPVEDCYAGLVWTAKNAASLQINLDRLVIGGASAGGGLAAALTLMARDRRGPKLAASLLIYPMLDDRNETISSRQFVGRGVWDRGSNETGWTALLGSARGGPDVSPYAAPARATDLSGLPPTFIDVGSAEVFRDEDVTYANRIWHAGGVCELHVWPGGFHGFDAFAPTSALAISAVRVRNDWLRRIVAL